LAVESNQPKFLIIAHRGESFEAPENTSASVNLAWQNNDEAVEIDVRLSGDKKIVVIHDATTKRTGDFNKRIVKTPLKILRKIDVGIFKGERWRNEKIPTLEEILKNMPPGKILFIEIKSNKNIIENFVKLFRKINPDANSVKIISFNFRVLKLLKMKLPQFEYYLLYQQKLPFYFQTIDSLITKVKKAGLDGLDLDYRMIKSENRVKKIKKENLKLIVWTVNNFETAIKLKQWGVDGITTDKAKLLREFLSKKGTK